MKKRIKLAMFFALMFGIQSHAYAGFFNVAGVLFGAAMSAAGAGLLTTAYQMDTNSTLLEEGAAFLDTRSGVSKESLQFHEQRKISQCKYVSAGTFCAVTGLALVASSLTTSYRRD